ncbi:PTS IIA-like nitrogen regulatory protein PtsN [Acuticoccus yangtzensis]|uniref:PTS IIA-like nitrogen regulatory protein PtsN n=1 Tax=Acuticoccus yangtzensis TaxID=1443441 RepID=UPI000949AD32|nr:PTS IIA-like nitrogen regulatory protein PtsN [Acuticoccus yangtzensis]ORE93095.1 phosphoenolpyruvate-dependent sugar phosphotransferase [Stappia sp. 22II-S9-Z10]
MVLTDLLAPDSVVQGLDVGSKKQALQEIASLAARRTGLPEREVFDTLLQRERLGSTGVGHGIAIPHGKLVGLSKLSAFFFTLAQPIDFEALDDQPVDLVFCLLAPEDAGADHLKALNKIARTVKQPGMIDALRAAEDAKELYALLTAAAAQAPAAQAS